MANVTRTVDRALERAAKLEQTPELDEATKRFKSTFAELAAMQPPEGANVLPVVLNTEDFATHNFGGKGYRDVTYNELLNKAGEAPGVVMQNTFDPGAQWARKQTDVYAVKDPSRVRLRNAAFDPKQRLSPDLLASYLLPFGALGGLGAAYFPSDSGIR
jgi:hypothetical protein